MRSQPAGLEPNHDEQAEQACRVHQRLLEVYGTPDWRDPLPPLDELVCTILSQGNTNDRNRDVAYTALRRSFPTWEQGAEPMPGLRKWSMPSGRPAWPTRKGHVSRPPCGRKSLPKPAAWIIGSLRNLAAEEARQWLLRFKGVGPKTAAIILQFSLGIPAFPVDTHIQRVSGRIGPRPEAMTVEQAHAHRAVLFPPDSYGPVHLNLIRLGHGSAQARKPDCPACPLGDLLCLP